MYKPTTETITVESYPYGRLRTKAMFSIEFKPNKGFRSVFQTINPKTGRINNPKKGTYHDIMLISQNDEGFVKFHAYELYKLEDVEKISKLINDNFNLFTTEQIKHIYKHYYQYFKVTIISMVTYCNSDKNKVIKLLDSSINRVLKGFKSPELNLFSEINIDVEALEATEEKGYQPFIASIL